MIKGSIEWDKEGMNVIVIGRDNLDFIYLWPYMNDGTRFPCL
jgi:hypothetical protein